MHEITNRYAGRTRAGFSRKTSVDEDLRPGELDGAITRARTGDGAALAYLYLRFADNVYGYVRSIVADDHAAEDVTQQVFTRLISAIRGYEPRGIPFSAWLMRVAHNTAVDHLRRQRTVPYEDTRPEPETREQLRNELGPALREALAELPAGQREVVVLRHVRGWSPGEIAHQLRKSENSVHALHHRGRRALRAALETREVMPRVMAS